VTHLKDERCLGPNKPFFLSVLRVLRGQLINIRLGQCHMTQRTGITATLLVPFQFGPMTGGVPARRVVVRCSFSDEVVFMAVIFVGSGEPCPVMPADNRQTDHMAVVAAWRCACTGKLCTMADFAGIDIGRICHQIVSMVYVSLISRPGQRVYPGLVTQVTLGAGHL